MRIRAALIAACLTFPPAVWALDKEPFTPERLEALQADGALILIDVYATWCPTCARQQEVLEKYVAEHPDVDLNVLVVDFDQDREHVRALRAPRQSTLLLFRGEQQFWYSVAETRKDIIFEAINRAAQSR